MLGIHFPEGYHLVRQVKSCEVSASILFSNKVHPYVPFNPQPLKCLILRFMCQNDSIFSPSFTFLLHPFSTPFVWVVLWRSCDKGGKWGRRWGLLIDCLNDFYSVGYAVRLALIIAYWIYSRAKPTLRKGCLKSILTCSIDARLTTTVTGNLHASKIH